MITLPTITHADVDELKAQHHQVMQDLTISTPDDTVILEQLTRVYRAIADAIRALDDATRTEGTLLPQLHTLQALHAALLADIIARQRQENTRCTP